MVQSNRKAKSYRNWGQLSLWVPLRSRAMIERKEETKERLEMDIKNIQSYGSLQQVGLESFQVVH